MTINFTAEEIFEDKLINQLAMGASQWTYEPDIQTEDQLWANFKNILEKNNKDKLDGLPLSEGEFAQIKEQVSFTSFYKAGEWLTGENGIVKVDVQRDDTRLGTVRLDVFNRLEKAGGTSVYQVINQFQMPKSHEMGRDGRFDVTLLFNGLPLIHIELKNKRHSFEKALNQIQGYIDNQQFTGLYSCVQVFVISNATGTRYISANKKLNPEFLIRWVDKDNRPVEDLIGFAKQVLRIPEAHELVTDYSVLDHKKESVIVLRPYQIHAVKAVKEAVKKAESGYVWHTTGSGKTLTSYKVARNLLQSPALDKSIFIVDRVDLDQQTTSSFMSYAKNDTIEIDETDNVGHLIRNLVSHDRTVVVTTIQKLNYVMKLARENPDDKRLQSLKQLKLAFVVDECHRAISPQKHEEIQQFFPRSLWYGFTGTPIFKENARAELGDLARTTEEQYGRRLHEYTIKEAIADGSVLGFQVEYKATIDDNTMMDIVEEGQPGLDASSMEMEDVEKAIPSNYYEDDGHMLRVIDYIINQSTRKFNLQKGKGRNFNAILTTSSIEKAQRYYELFKEVKEGKRQVKVSDRTKKLLADFPKVAITYSIAENEEGSSLNQEKMAEALTDYNDMYGTSFNLSTVKAYNVDLNNRIARKEDKYWARPQQIDLVIVVDRLLTGFDAPSLGILFMDRSPMTPQGLIQSFSRTNRIFNDDKRYGQIVTFQTPRLFKEEVDEAFVLYSNGGENYIQAPSWEEAQAEFVAALAALRKAAPDPEATTNLATTPEKVAFVKAFQNFDKTLAAVQVYSDFEEETWQEDYGITAEEIEDYHGHYVNIKEELKEGNDQVHDLIDINYELSTVQKAQIDYAYIVLLLQTQTPADDKNEEERKAESDPKLDQELQDSIEELKAQQPKLGQVVEDLYLELKKDKYQFKNQDIGQVLQERLTGIQLKNIEDFANEYVVDEEDLAYYALNYQEDLDGKQYGENQLLDLDKLNHEEYNKRHQTNLKKFEYRIRLREELVEFVREQIEPYQV